MRTRAMLFLFALVFSSVVYAGTTGQVSLHMPQAENASRPFGDWVSDNDAGALNTFYRYFIEVPAGVARLQVEIFDADVGLGGAGEDDAGRDRDRAGGYGSTATYSLLDPNGTARTVRFTTGTAALPVGSDNAWLDLYNATGNNVLDTFATNVYTRNDGNNNWTGNWTETDGGGGGATGGSIQVIGGELRLQDVSGGAQSIFREADLLGTPGLNMGMAFLTFSYRTSGTLEAGDNLLVEISGNGGASYTTLETFSDDSTGTRSYDITAFIANNTRVRFSIPGGDYSAANEFFFADNVQISDGPITNGHWELRVDMTQGAQTDDINALGIRAHDGTAGAGGTELNVYADSMVSLGVNPDPGADTRTFALHPWVTSGCTLSSGDFDVDTDSGNTGNVVFTSRSGGFTQTFTDAVLSINNVWAHNNTAQFTDDNFSDDYGTWTVAPTINTYAGPSGNYETFYVGNYLDPATNPTTNPILSGGNPATFRLYLPTDAGTSPSKPYIEQFVTQIGGPQTPPAPGVPRNYTISVRVENPAAQAITFNASNLVTANVPGAGAVYGGNAQVSQGSIVAQPGVGGTGNITWNPGSLAAGGVAVLAYEVTVTAGAGARIAVTGTPASGNGTRAQFIDETGNATQTRARYTAGGICELAVTQGLATAVLLSRFNVDVRGGATTVEWTTASEAGTAGFNLYRANGERVNPLMIPASLKPHGGKYRFVDTGNADPNATYFVEEVAANGLSRRFGPLNHFEGVDRERQQERRRIRTAAADSWMVEPDAANEQIVAVMVGVRSTGVVRIPAADLATAFGTETSEIEKLLAIGKVNVTHRGTQVAWQADGQNLYFFGEKSTSIYSNDRVYRVELAKGVKMQIVPVSGAPTPVSSFIATQEIETDVFAATVLPLDPESDYWFWEAFISGDPTWGTRTFNINVPAMASASRATIEVRLQGAFKDTTHRARISLNGSFVGETTWTSFNAKTATFNLPEALLRDGANEIVMDGILEGGASVDIFYVDGFTLKYQKFARPESGQIEVKKTGTVGAGPFAGAPYVLDVTNRNRPTLLTGATFSGGMASLVTPARTKDLFLTQSFVAPSFLRGSGVPQFKSKQRADWVVVAPRTMRASAESLAQLRQRDGLVTYVADLQQIYDEFAGGNVTPHAIKDFFTWARTWSKPPRYFVLAGTGTVDYRGIEVAPGPLPPLMTSTPDGLYASDSLFVDRNGDRLPDVAIGRIPVSSAAELSAYVAKLEANSTIGTSTAPIVFSADVVDQGTNFKQSSVQAEAPLASRPSTHVYLDDLGGAAARTALLSAWQSGTPLVSWVGHGGLDQISSSGVLTAYDAPDLDSSGRLPVLLAMTCTINRFENGYVDPLGTALTKQEGAGALAVWSASGLSLQSQASDIQRTFLRLAQNSPTARVGDLVVQSLALYKNDTSSIYLLLGDPAIRLGLPSEVSNVGGPSSTGE